MAFASGLASSDFKADGCLTESLFTRQMRAERRDAPQPVVDFIQSHHSAGLLALAFDTNAFGFASHLEDVNVGHLAGVEVARRHSDIDRNCIQPRQIRGYQFKENAAKIPSRSFDLREFID